MRRTLVCSSLALIGAFVSGAVPAVAPVPALAQDVVKWEESALGVARRLRSEGRDREAFLAFLAIPGGEHAAARIGRARPAEFLELLGKEGAGVPALRAKLIQGDLHLALGDKVAALACFRAAAAEFVSAKSGSYPVEPPAGNGERESQPPDVAPPFAFGPGSHRDNWLVRRFIALDAWDDAAAEFARVWEIHRSRSLPYVLPAPARRDGGDSGAGDSGGGGDGRDGDGRSGDDTAPAPRPRLVTPAGFDGSGLQFALDYAFLLRRNGPPDRALALLLEPLLRIDGDRDPNRLVSADVSDEEAAKHPVRPGIDRYRGSWGPGLRGVSRKEYVRLVYGAFATDGKSQDLVRALEEKIAAGDNAMRWVLARVRLHEGRPDDALALRLDHVRHAGLDPMNTALRRGLVFEDAGRPAEAIASFEQALTLPFAPPLFPDPDEPDGESAIAISFRIGPPGRTDAAGFRADLALRLERLYTATAQPDKAVDASLRRFEADSSLLSRFDELAQTGTRARAAGLEAEFRARLTKMLPSIRASAERANVHWLLRDLSACARALAESWRSAPAVRDLDAPRPGPAGGRRSRASPPGDFAAWRDRFREAGAEELRTFLTTVVSADPGNLAARLELLAGPEPFEGPEVISAFETLLESGADFAFVRTPESLDRTHFRGPFDLALRLMRLYERAGRIGDLRALGMRVASGGAPFGAWWKADPERDRHRNGNGEPEDLNACLALLIARADDAALDELDRLWKDRGDFPARRQLARRRAGSFGTDAPAPDIGWANLPDGVRALVSHETVLSLARDETRIYAGQPWGVAVYDLAGAPVTRIALGDAARAITVGTDAVWAGTPSGLFRIDRGSWDVSHIPLDRDVPEGERRTAREPGDAWFDHSVYSLAADGDDLWIGMHRNVQRLDMRAMKLRAFSYAELGVTSWGGFDRILPDGPYVWAGNRELLRRFDKAAGTWAKVELGTRGVVLVGRIGGVLYGHAWVSEELRDRPCIVDRDTLQVTPLLIQGDGTARDRMINGPFTFFGRLDGRLVFGADRPQYVLDPDTRRLRPLGDDATVAARIESILPPGARTGPLWWSGDPLAAAPSGGAATVVVRGVEGGGEMLHSPDGVRVFARGADGRPRYEVPNEDWPFGKHVWDTREDAGGLFLRTADGRETCISSLPRGDVLAGDSVFALVPADESGTGDLWACTRMGLAVLAPDGHVRRRFTRADGLCANRVTSGVRAGGRTWFSAGWGDHGGGLILADPATALFTTLGQAEGLATDKLLRLEAAEGRIRLVYDTEYLRYGGGGRRRFPPGLLDPSNGMVESGGAAKFMQSDDGFRPVARDRMPCIGGFATGRQRIGDRTYALGTRGILTWTGDAVPALRIREIVCPVTVDPDVELQREAAKVPRLGSTIHSEPPSPDDLAQQLGSPNPFIRARVLANLPWGSPGSLAPLAGVIASSLRDPHLRPRATALYVLTRIAGDEVIGPLHEALHDADARIRALAAMELARRERPVPIARYAEILEGKLAGYPFDATSTIDADLARRDVWEALAPHAGADVFRLFLQHPPRPDDHDNRTKVFPQLGESLRGHPEAAPVLLAAYDDARDGGTPRRNFTREVFRYAGVSMLPVLLEALGSGDRVVRSNAAQACGAIGDPAAVPHLLRALDFESSLSRASIVEALGELRATEALPRLLALYADARTAERRAATSGILLGAQATAATQGQYEQIRDLDSIGSDWDEVRAAARPAPVDLRHEPLLTTRGILEAVRKIGPESSQAFYRELAGSTDEDARREAAARLAECAEGDRAANVAVLRGLRGDGDVTVRVRATVSLLVLGAAETQATIVQWIDGKPPESGIVVSELARVKKGADLAFARDALVRFAERQARVTSQDDRAKKLLRRIDGLSE